MYIKHIQIHNFRSIRDLEIHCQRRVTLVGPNNHGKSNVLLAIEFGLSPGAKVGESDFFRVRSDDVLWVEMVFDELTEQEKTTFRKYLRTDATIRIRKTARIDASAAVEVNYNGWVQEPEQPALRSDAVKDICSREAIAATPLKDLVPTSGRLTAAMVESARLAYIEQHKAELTFAETLETGPLLGIKTVAGGVLPDFYMVPAVRDLSEETKVRSTTIFGKLLTRALRQMADTDARFAQVKEQLAEIVSRFNAQGSERPPQLFDLERALQTELSEWGVNVAIEVTPPLLEKVFELGTNLHLDDGVQTLAEQKGHGLQRAVIFALIRAWANVLHASAKGERSARAASDSTVFAFEEPELFLHPHAQRRLAQAIGLIAESTENQVFVCTHSTYFVDLNRYKQIAIITKPTPERGTCITQCIQDLFEDPNDADRKSHFRMAHWINPDRGEMFFARRVLLVEGDTEKTLLPYLAERLGCLDNEISIVDCGSKFNLPLYIAIAKAFGIPYVVVHDVDPLPDPIPAVWGEDKVIAANRAFAMNAVIQAAVIAPLGRVETLDPDFEGVAGVSKRQGEKKGKPLAALDHFEEKDNAEVPDRIQELVRSAFGPLRAAAVG